MTEREKKSTTELEALCLAALKNCIGMKDLQKVKVVPYDGKLSFTWKIGLYDGNIGEQAVLNALPEVRKLQQTYDLK